jgi:hypothetical protein
MTIKLIPIVLCNLLTSNNRDQPLLTENLISGNNSHFPWLNTIANKIRLISNRSISRQVKFPRKIRIYFKTLFTQNQYFPEHSRKTLIMAWNKLLLIANFSKINPDQTVTSMFNLYLLMQSKIAYFDMFSNITRGSSTSR